jgi:hypothetical protein
MPDDAHKTLPCTCVVATQRDFLGRVVGTIVTKGAQCTRAEHTEGHVTVMAGRENARPE